MAKQKLTLQANPTFKTVVGIPVPGEKDVAPVEFIFKHRTKSELKVWREAINLDDEGITLEHILDIAQGWDLPDEFNAENVTRMLDQYPGSGLAIFAKYISELQDARLGNLGR